MTPEYIKEALATLRECAGDSDIAHGMEDRLHREVLRAIASGQCAEPAECASLALTSENIDFARHTA